MKLFIIFLSLLSVVGSQTITVFGQAPIIVNMHTTFTQENGVKTHEVMAIPQTEYPTIFSYLPQSPQAIGFSIAGIAVAYFVIKKYRLIKMLVEYTKILQLIREVL